MTALDDVYQDQLLAYAGEIARNTRLADADTSAKVVSRSCGSEVTVDLTLRDGVITDYGQEVEACALGSASASIFGHVIIGKTVDEVRRVRDQMRAMLKKGGPPPEGDWSEFRLLEPARAFGNRHQSILLPFNATIRAAEKLAGSA
ncbi:MAG: iron-sulfur cluster assembly scaffold protein [Alphaproteobacteria bacterium]|jgi:NifU-like protein involved in Fe-S cluster formation|nr:iron-sulfur cluster assembly scaffold protein [Alphaproteobacteria bacterium]